MFTVQQVLLTGGVKFSKYAGCHAGNVYITDGHQLIGKYKDLEAFRGTTEDYAGWHVHHVVEDDDLARLGVSGNAPAYPSINPTSGTERGRSRSVTFSPAPAHRPTRRLRLAQTTSTGYGMTS